MPRRWLPQRDEYGLAASICVVFMIGEFAWPPYNFHWSDIVFTFVLSPLVTLALFPLWRRLFSSRWNVTRERSEHH